MMYEYMMKKEVKQAASDQRSNLNWAVGYIIPAETQDDGKNKIQIVACFNYPTNAENFIDTLPQENKNRFFVTRIN